MTIARRHRIAHVVALVTWLTSAALSRAAAQTTIHVPADVPSIGQAISQAQDGDTVLVAPGVYYGNFVFQGKAITVASSDGPAVTILDANNVSSGPLFFNGEGPQSILKGFTITHGVSASSGAGISISNSSPTIDGNIITANQGCEGIGIEADNSSAVIKNNVITNNTPAGCSGAGGGGIKVSGPGNAQILNNTITGNQVWGLGGGIELNSTTLVTITGNTIQNNSATNNGGGISVENGSQATIVNNLITGNTGFLGPGIYLVSSFGNQNVLVNNTIAFNVLEPGVTNLQQVWMTGSQTGTQFVNNVIVDGTGSGAVGCDPGSAFGASFTFNDILSTQPTTPPQPAPPFVGCVDVTGTNGNISLDPQFVNPAGNDYHLQASSPAIDAGSNSAPSLPDKDLDGNARIGPGNVSTCVGIVDMGAYELALNSTATGFLTTSSLDFGTVVVGNSGGPQTLNAFVQGCAQIASIATTGDFSQTNTCGHALSSGSCSIQITFTPTVGGPRSGSLEVDFGSSATSVTANLTGQGLVVPASASPTSLTFVGQTVGTTSAAQTVTVLGGGNGTMPLQISSVSITGDYVQTNSCFGPPIAAPNCLVDVSFAPTALGSRPGTMVINTNQGSFTIALNGTGVVFGQLSSSSLTFGNQLVNTSSSPQAVTFTNSGSSPIQISGFSLSGDFSLGDNCPATLAQGAFCTINVTFTPTAVGTRSGSFSVFTNLGTPSATLSGTGVVPVATLSPAALTFATQLLNTTSSAQTVTLSNTGGATLQISSIAASGDFAQTNTCGPSLDPGASCSVSVTFTPTVPGSDNGSLVVSGNFGNPVTVALNGSGQAQGASGTLSPAFLIFPNQSAGTTSPAQTVTYTNTGTVALSISSLSIRSGPFAQTNNCGTTLAVGASCTIHVTYTPPNSTGQFGFLDVGSSASASIVLTGYSIPLPLSPASLDFGKQVINSVSPVQTVTLTNTTASTIFLNAEGSSSGINVVNNCLNGINPAASCTFDLTFSPKAAGAFSGFFGIAGTFPGSTAVIPVVGIGTGSGGTLSPVDLFFANQAVNTTSSAQQVTLTNTGVGPLHISAIQATGDFVQTNGCPATLLPNANCWIAVVFAPTAGGTRTGSVSVSSDAPFPIPPVALSGTGVAESIGAFSPRSLQFGSVFVNTASPAQTVILSNTGVVTMDVGLGMTGDFSQTNNCGGSLAPGASCSINVVFSPIATGSRTGAMRLFTSSGIVPPPVSLVGTGVASPLTASPASLTFPVTPPNTSSAAQTVTLTNSGGSPVAISGATITGDYAQTNNCGTSLDPGASCTFSIAFTPTVQGSDNGSLTVNSNFGTVVVPLHGAGQAQGASGILDPPFLIFPNQAVNTTSAAQTLTYTNNGEVSLSIASVAVTFGPFAQTNNCGAALAPGASCTINVTFTPPNSAGQEGVLTVSGTAGAFTVLTGYSISPQLISPGSLDFGRQTINAISPIQTVTFTNTTANPIFISSWSWSSSFNVVSHCPGSVDVGASCTFDVTFAPTAHGSSPGSFAVSGNFPGSPAVIPTAGTGAGGGGTLSPSSLSFASQPVGTTSASKPVTLTNTGDVNLSISSIQITGDFSQTNNCPATLISNASCTVNVSFTPTATGAGTGSLTVASDAPAPIPAVSLSGTGAAPGIGAFSPQSLAFGSVAVNANSASQTVTLSNTGTATLTFTLGMTGDFSQTNNCGGSLAPGASCSINVVFSPTAMGNRTGTLSLSTSSGPTPAPVSFTGTGTMAIATLSTISLPFAPQVVGTASPAQSLTLSNIGNATLSVTGMSFAGSGAGQFSQTNNCGSALAPGSSCTINVTFAPLDRGAWSATLSIVTNSITAAPGVLVSGTGQAILATASPASLSFAAAPLNTTSAAQTITFTNAGDTTATITGVLISGDFAQTNNCGTSLAVGASCTVNVTFTPTARGSRTGTVTLQGNFTSPAPVVNLSGTGQAFLASLTPASFDFGNEPVNTTTNPQLFTYTNTGDLALTISGVAVTPDFNQTNNCPASLAVNASCIINVTFVPRSTGTQTASLTVSGTVNSSSSVTGTGVMPLATLSPTSLNFGNQRVGTSSAPQLVTVTNTGAFPFFVNQWSLPAPYQVTNNCPSPGVVAVGASCTLSVVFAPTSAGSFPGTLTIGGDFTPTPSSIGLSGTGAASAGTLSPTALTFAGQVVGTTSAAQTLTLTSTGNIPTSLSGIQATGDFAQTNNCGASLVAGASCVINVTFTPTAHGSRTGTISVSGDFTSAAPSATLSGNGTIPTANWSPASLSFANQLVGSASTGQGVTLTNNGDGPLTISAITATGDFAQTNNCGSTLAPGASCTIAVTFTPSASGARSGTLSLTGNSSTTVSPVSLSGMGVVPVAALSAASLNFGNQLVNTSSAAQSVTLSNTGTAALTINSISVTGDFSQTNNCPSSLAAGGSCAINVTFIPAARLSRVGSLAIQSNSTPPAPGVALSGTGIAPVPAFSPGAISFGNQRVGTSSAAQVLTLANNGDAALSLNGFLITGSSEFTQTNNCPGSLAPGQNCSVSVVFTPGSRGAKAATISVNTQPLFTTSATLSGTGIAPAATLTPSLDFGSQDLHTSATQNATLSNVGEFPLTISSISISGGAYSQSHTCGSSLAAGSSCTIQVKFNANALGTMTGSLTVADNDPAGATQVAALTGTGVDFAVSSSPTSVTVAAGQTASYTISVAPLGGDFPNGVSLTCGSLPAGTTCTFSSDPVVPGSRSAASVLNITTSNGQNGTAKTSTGSHGISISGVSGGLKHNVSVTLVVD